MFILVCELADTIQACYLGLLLSSGPRLDAKHHSKCRNKQWYLIELRHQTDDLLFDLQFGGLNSFFTP
jgi:hypothetical protein